MSDLLIKRTVAQRRLGLTREQMLAAERKGLLRIIRLNARDFRVPEDDIASYADRAYALQQSEQRRAAMGVTRSSERAVAIATRLWGDKIPGLGKRGGFGFSDGRPA